MRNIGCLLPGILLVTAVTVLPLAGVMALSLADARANYAPWLTADGAGIVARTVLLAACTAGVSCAFAGAWAFTANPRDFQRIAAAALVPKLAGSLALLLGLRLTLGHVAPGALSTFPAAVLAEAVLVTPYLVLILLAERGRLDPQLTSAARSLGATPWQAFAQVTWPQLRPGVVLAFLLAFTWGLGSAFGVTLLGRPRDTTVGAEVLRQAFDYANPGRAAAAATLLTGLTLPPLAAWAALSGGRR